MKTPRDILFARHQAAAPKLDALRRSVVTELNNQDAKTRSVLTSFATWRLGGSNKLWLELIWPCRRVWSGLATIWILLFIINLSQRDNVSSVTGKPVRSGGAVMNLQAQQRWMNELLADRSVPVEADRPRPFSPKPRTETKEMMTV